MKIYDNITQLVGNTPLVRLNSIEKEFGLKAQLYGKLEALNPAGSAKDRVGLAMIEDAEKRGILKPGSVIIEPTSGNTGIGLASAAASKGYKVILTMPDTMSVERRNLLKAYGAQLVLTEGARGMQGAVEKAEELAAQTEGSFIPGQFDILTVSDEDAYSKGRLIAAKEGVLVGITSGAAVHAAVVAASRPENEGKNIVAFLPDTGDRYLSTPMFV